MLKVDERALKLRSVLHQAQKIPTQALLGKLVITTSVTAAVFAITGTLSATDTSSPIPLITTLKDSLTSTRSPEKDLLQHGGDSTALMDCFLKERLEEQPEKVEEGGAPEPSTRVISNSQKDERSDFFEKKWTTPTYSSAFHLSSSDFSKEPTSLTPPPRKFVSIIVSSYDAELNLQNASSNTDQTNLTQNKSKELEFYQKTYQANPSGFSAEVLRAAYISFYRD